MDLNEVEPRGRDRRADFRRALMNEDADPDDAGPGGPRELAGRGGPSRGEAIRPRS